MESILIGSILKRYLTDPIDSAGAAHLKAALLTSFS